MGTPVSVEEYVAAAPPAAREALTELRALVHRVVPEGEDAIRYGIAARLRGGRTVVHYGAWTHHVSVYPVPASTEADPDLAADLAAYVHGRGTLRFPHDQPLPVGLLERVVTALAQR